MAFFVLIQRKVQISNSNLKRYQSEQYFKKVHTEGINLETLYRMFAWMRYLNYENQKDSGSMFFSHYDFAIQARQKADINPAHRVETCT